MKYNETALYAADYRVVEGNVLRARVAAASGSSAGQGSMRALGWQHDCQMAIARF